jgi:hypothetical protein
MRQLDVVLFESFRSIWGLTRDFWAENGKRKITARITAIE